MDTGIQKLTNIEQITPVKKFMLAHKINHGRVIKNDPSAGSPTETLLRLLLPLENLICKF